MNRLKFEKSLRIATLVACMGLGAGSAPSAALAENETINVTLLGTGTPILNINRFGMSTLVEAGGTRLLFDAGRGAAVRLHQRQVPLSSLDAVFITHLHSDHLTGLPDLYASAPLPTDDGRSDHPLTVVGPVGIDQVARGIEMMFAPNNEIRKEEIKAAATKIEDTAISADGGIVYDAGGVKVTAFRVEHGAADPAYGYRVDYGGRSLVLSGDTTLAPNVVKFGNGADLLIHSLSVGSRELEAAEPEYVNKFYSFLANPEAAGQVMSQAKPQLAVFSHISLYSKGQIGRASEEEITERVRAAYPGEFVLGQDLMSFTITAAGVEKQPYDPAIRQEEPVKSGK